MSADSYDSMLYEMSCEEVRNLCGSGLDINAPDSYGDYLITVACARLQLENVTLLLSMGANPNVKNSEGNTPLLCAIDVAQHNEPIAVEITKILIAAGADLELRGYMDKTPFLKACSRGCLEVLKVLVANGCDINAVAHDFDGNDSGLELADIFHTSIGFRAYLRELYRAA